MAWSLLGVVVIELLLLLESLITFVWRLLVKGIKRLHIVDNSRKFMAYRKQQEAIRNQENRDEEERLLRLALEHEKATHKEVATNDSEIEKTISDDNHSEQD